MAVAGDRIHLHSMRSLLIFGSQQVLARSLTIQVFETMRPDGYA